MKLILRGHIPGKKNMLRRSKNGGLYRDASVSKQIDALILQAKAQWKGNKPFEKARIEMAFVFRDQRSDLDNKLTCALDILVQAGIIENDNLKHLREIYVSGHVGPEEKCTIWISPNND